jgi:hypothetical protein
LVLDTNYTRIAVADSYTHSSYWKFDWLVAGLVKNALPKVAVCAAAFGTF